MHKNQGISNLFAICSEIEYNRDMAKLPIYLEMKGRRAVVIGAGAVAVRKVQSLVQARARVTVVAEHVQNNFLAALQVPQVELVISTYRKDYLVGATLVIAATNDLILNRQVFEDCQELEILCNVVDQPELCDFYVPAVVQRGDLQIAIGTDGHCPAYAGHIRKKLEEVFTEEHGRFVDQLESIRIRVLNEISDANQRKAILGRLVSDDSFDIFQKEGLIQWLQFADEQIHQDIIP
jgi:precorrin-2 dehydrogenase/sirohydrochlorin ferrochelatase